MICNRNCTCTKSTTKVDFQDDFTVKNEFEMELIFILFHINKAIKKGGILNFSPGG